MDLLPANVRCLPLDRHERRAAARLLGFQAHGEHIALAGARAQARLAHLRATRRFLRRQARQELFHARLFQRAAALLDAESAVVEIPPPLARVRTALTHAIDQGAWSDAVVIQHVALEGLGHAVLALLDAELPGFDGRFARLRRMILAQEDEHFAFGARVLTQHAGNAHIDALVFRMLDEAESLMQSVAPQFELLGGNIADVVEPLRAGTLAAMRNAA